MYAAIFTRIEGHNVGVTMYDDWRAKEGESRRRRRGNVDCSLQQLPHVEIKRI